MGSPPSGTRANPSVPGNTPSPDSCRVPIANGLMLATRGDIWGCVGPRLPYRMASTTSSNMAASPSTKSPAGDAASTTPTTLPIKDNPSTKANPSASRDCPSNPTTKSTCASYMLADWKTGRTNTTEWPLKSNPGSPYNSTNWPLSGPVTQFNSLMTKSCAFNTPVQPENKNVASQTTTAVNFNFPFMAFVVNRHRR